MGKFFGFMAILLLGSFAYFALRPIGEISIGDVDKILGTIETISQKSNDIIIHLENRDEIYTIHNGVKKGIILRRMKKSLEGKIITMYYLKNDFKHFDPLDINNNDRYVAKIRSINEVVYNEIK